MTLQLVDMIEEHVRALDAQIEQSDLSIEERISVAMAQAGYGPSWAAVDGERVLAVGGLCITWPTRAVCWAGLARDLGAQMVPLTRAVRRLMDAQPFTRFEMYVDARSSNAQRWARMLGFRNETPEPMRAFLPDGSAAYLYART